MKKVLLAVVAIVIVAGFIGGKMMYDKSKFDERIADLAKFEPPEDFLPLLAKENLKKIKAPIYDFRALGTQILPEMLEVLKTTSYPENARLAALIVVAHIKDKDSVDPLIEALRSTEGRFSECAAVFLQLHPQENVPKKIAEAATDSGLDKKLRMNAYLAMQRWASRKVKMEKDKLKRRRNKSLKSLALEGLDSDDEEIRKHCIRMIPYITFSWEPGEDEAKSEIVTVIEKVLPMLKDKDEDMATKAFESVNQIIVDMGNPTELLDPVIKLVEKGDKDLTLRAAHLIDVIYKNEEEESRKDLERIYSLLEQKDKEVLLKAIQIMSNHGRQASDRVALKNLTENADEEISKAAKDAQQVIMKREKEG